MGSRSFLLAAVVAAFVAAPAGAATIVNGGFDDVSVAAPGLVGGAALNALSGSQWNVFAGVPGWTATSGYGIEIQRNSVVRAHSGNYYVELDSHPHRNLGGDLTATTNSAMSQTLSGLSAGVYDLSFFYRPRTSEVGSNLIGFGLSGAVQGGSVAGVVGLADGYLRSQWTEVTQRFTATGGDVTLSFSALGDADQTGGFIDTVSVSAVPLPAGAWLMLTGLAALGVARRRARR